MRKTPRLTMYVYTSRPQGCRKAVKTTEGDEQLARRTVEGEDDHKTVIRDEYTFVNEVETSQTLKED